MSSNLCSFDYCFALILFFGTVLIQGGYGTSLAPANLVGKLFTTFDRSIHRMIGAPPAPLPPLPQGSVNDKETYYVAPRVANSQSTMAMSSLVPSASVETMSEWKGDDGKQTRHNRSISEPDFGRSPKQVDSSLLGESEFVQLNLFSKLWLFYINFILNLPLTMIGNMDSVNV